MNGTRVLPGPPGSDSTDSTDTTVPRKTRSLAAASDLSVVGFSWMPDAGGATLTPEARAEPVQSEAAIAAVRIDLALNRNLSGLRAPPAVLHRLARYGRMQCDERATMLRWSI